MTRDEAIKQLDWYFNEDDGIAADNKTHAAYAALRIIGYSYDGCATVNDSLLSICPVCGGVTSWSDYFGRYICSSCGWEGLDK